MFQQLSYYIRFVDEGNEIGEINRTGIRKKKNRNESHFTFVSQLYHTLYINGKQFPLIFRS